MSSFIWMHSVALKFLFLVCDHCRIFFCSCFNDVLNVVPSVLVPLVHHNVEVGWEALLTHHSPASLPIPDTVAHLIKCSYISFFEPKLNPNLCCGAKNIAFCSGSELRLQLRLRIRVPWFWHFFRNSICFMCFSFGLEILRLVYKKGFFEILKGIYPNWPFIFRKK